MSTSSHHSRGYSRRVDSLPGNGTFSRENSYQGKRAVEPNDAYLYALRVAYLAYLLQPRAKRMQHVPAPPTLVARPTLSLNDLMKDFNPAGPSKSTRLPHGFLTELDKRLTGVLMGKEKKPEYNDKDVKRTFAAFFNAFKEPGFNKRMEKDRRVEDLVLIFYSNATKELSKGKVPTDDAWKMMVDRHLALLVRLFSLVLKDNDWARERPELASRLTSLESKLLSHDADLSAAIQNGTGTTTIEVVVPLSYEVKDMPLVLVVGQIFGLRNTMLQSDINKYKPVWTEKAALQDLKTYQAHLNLNTRKTLRNDDFDLDEAYDLWKKNEAHDLSQMMMTLIQVNPELAKSTTTSNLSLIHAQPIKSEASEWPDPLRKTNSADGASSYGFDQPVDMSSADPGNGSADHSNNDENVFTFIPVDARGHYRYILAEALKYDLNSQSQGASDAADGGASSPKLLSKQSTDLLNEICLRWHLPLSSRSVLFLDIIKERFVDQDISLDTLDAAFNYIRNFPQEKGKTTPYTESILLDRNKWPILDVALMQQIISTLHVALLRDLFDTLQHCYEPKPPSVGPIIYVMENYIFDDPSFSKTSEELVVYRDQLHNGLVQKAHEMYRTFLEDHVPNDQSSWDFLHVIELGKTVVALAQKIQKRYRKNPEVMGVNPLTALLETILPLYAQDARDIVKRIILVAQEKNEELPVEDGFTLYGELVEIRRIHAEALPNVDFAFHIEGLLADFVWRWIRLTEASTTEWVENAVKQDNFAVRCEKDQIPTEEQRHSVSVIDVFSSFNQTIDRIVQLNWDDDLQYAKFMTSLAKVVGAGIARYCEITERKFSKEMDRLSPEQEAARNQSTQEKWLSLAKDAWNNKEKIEPFQFFPESFVKLNNVDFSAQQLDRLEREVNVDACAEVIQRNAPPFNPKRERKINNYVFTIKIVEAEDLKACDMGGFSDPYVVLGDEYQKRLAKTRVIYRNLNPRWEESVDITTQGPLNIIATVWDWDAVGDHDCCGRASLKLDPSHFGDFMPREYWLDLDTQGRILLRVSMEGERDDIQFYFGKAFRTIKRTERDMTRKITDKLSAYINHCLSRRTLKSLLSKGIKNVAISSVSNYFNLSRPAPVAQPPTDAEINNALKPLSEYFDDNFAIMNQTLTNSSMIMVMTRLWKEVLSTIESLLVPPLSDKPSQQKQLNQQELDIVFKWLQYLFEFFQAKDEETGEVMGVPLDVLRSPKYFDITTLNFFYFEDTQSLIRTSERMASATVARQQSAKNRLSAPALLSPGAHAFGGAAGLVGMPSTRRPKSIMLSRNLGTMKKAKQEKWKEAQADPSDDMILRILRMRPEAEKYLKDRSRQKERLAAAAAAELIVKQSLLANGGRMMGNLPRR